MVRLSEDSGVMTIREGYNHSLDELRLDFHMRSALGFVSSMQHLIRSTYHRLESVLVEAAHRILEVLDRATNRKF